MKKEIKDFTNQYELSKTLRFELKPTNATKIMLAENNVFKKDELIQKKYQQTKIYLDRLHREFARESLKDIQLSSLKKYNEALENTRRITRETSLKNKKDLEVILKKEETRLRKEIVNNFNETAKRWATEKYEGLKKKNIEILFEEAVFSSILKKRYGHEKETFIKIEKKDKNEKVCINENGEIIFEKYFIFDEWKGFTGYFTKFFETRKNFYKDDGTSTALATRIIDQNLRRFCDNLNDFKRIKDKIDFSEIEENFNVKITEVFILDFYNTCLLQDGIDEYNEILGGKTLETGEKLKGINELVNKYRQNNKNEKLPFLKSLDKQILSEKETIVFGIENEKELLSVLQEFQKTTEQKTKILKDLFNYFVNIKDDEELKQIYISKEAFNTISRKWTFETDIFEKVVFEAFKNIGNKKKSEDKYPFPDFISLFFIKNGLNSINNSDKFWKERYYKNLEDEVHSGFLKDGKKEHWQEFLDIFNYEFTSLFRKEAINNETGNKKIIGFEIAQNNLKNLLESSDFSLNKDEKLNKKEKVIIKEFADGILHIYQMAKYFSVEKKRKWNPTHLELGDFYRSQKTEGLENSFDGYEIFYNDAYEVIVQKYNDIRNYLTKKPWADTQKWKLNFENSTLAGGWDKNQETDNFAVILRKEERYFLGLMKKGCNHLFEDKNKENFNGIGYEKMVYKYFPSPSKMIPKTSTQVSEVKKHFKNFKENYFLENSSTLGKFVKPLKITKEVFDLNNFEYKKSYLATLGGQNPNELQRVKADSQKTSQVKLFQKEFLELSKNKNIYRQAVSCWIDFCKEYLKCFPSTGDGFLRFDKHIKNTEEYKSIDKFYRDVEKGGYKILFQNISENYIEEKNKNGELYLFQIKNKDWNKGSTGTKNLHTLYFENLFSQINFDKNFVFKLNGQAEIFYRPKAIEAKKVKRNFTREIIEKKRYTEDKTFFHMPIALNRGAEKPFPAKFNKNLNEFLANNPDINIIGVDRGEKHLAYYSIINQKQEILDSGTLNIIENFDNNGNKIYSNEKKIVEVRNNKNETIDYKLEETGKKVPYTNYKLLLEYKEKKRLVERQTWQAIEGIKELKKGYISQVIKKLADLAIEHNAIIVFEDLNMRFKQIRGGIEKSVYQQLEKALIEKLNFLVDKDKIDPKKAGHLLNAYQLTAPFETFQKMGKQTGILFYTTASYTSKIDPVTGWRPNLYLKIGNADLNKKTILKFSKIEFVNDRFEFLYDIKNFQEQKEYPKNTKWTVCSCVERFRWNRKLNNNKGGYNHYKNLTDDFQKLFENFKIDISENILEQIKNLDEGEIENKRFFSDFIFLFGLICQIRNTNNSEQAKEEGKDDFIFSPVKPFFDSRKDNGKHLPKNGDDNGAYNIARKGIITLNKISEWQEENKRLKKANKKEKYSPNLYISNQKWDNFTQK